MLSSDRCPRAGWLPAAPVGSWGWGPLVSGKTPHCCVGSRGRQGRWPSRGLGVFFVALRGGWGRIATGRWAGALCRGRGIGLVLRRGPEGFQHEGRSRHSALYWFPPFRSGGSSQASPGERCRLVGHAESARGAPQPPSSDLRGAAPGNAGLCGASLGTAGVPWPCALCGICFSGIQPCPRGHPGRMS